MMDFKLDLTKRYTMYKEQNMSEKVAINQMLFLIPVDLILLSKIDCYSCRFLYFRSSIKDINY